MTSQTLQQALLDPAIFPEKSRKVEFRETHVSLVFLLDHHVYKIKKDVDLGFLNFTTLDRRRFYCQEELRLNERFCPGTYLRVATIRRCGQHLSIDGAGEIVDYAVVMKRLPYRHMLVQRLASGDPGLPAEMDRLGRRLAALHRHSPIFSQGPVGSDFNSVQQNWQENFAQTSQLPETILPGQARDMLRRFIASYCRDQKSRFLSRERHGWVRDGHGDLHAEHICLTSPIRIFDCIEFNRRFRVADIAADIAFLLMDLDFRGRPNLSLRLLAKWCDGLDQKEEIGSLLRFYKIYRAFVRGKVNAFLARDSNATTPTKQTAERLAKAYFNLALGYLPQPTLILTCGLMGTGKTTLGRALATCLGAVQLRSDVLRKELGESASQSPGTDAYGAGLYSLEQTRQTYQLLLKRTLDYLAAGQAVVVDASFARRQDRLTFCQAAAATGRPYLLLFLGCSETTALSRLDQRQAAGKDESDGRRELYSRQVVDFSPPTAEEQPFLVDSEQEVDYNVTLIICELIRRNEALS